MSVLIETSLGDIEIDLFCKECPKACLNFLKLCKIKYYNNCIFYDVQRDYIAITGDPENSGKNTTSLYGIMYGEKQKYFEDEINPLLRHNKIGTISTANLGPNLNTSTFFINLNPNNSYLNDKHTIFGQVEVGLEVVEKLNKAYTDKEGRPYQNIRIKHTFVLDDPFDDPEGLIIPSKSPDLVKDNLEYNRLDDDFKLNDYFKDKETEAAVQEKLAEHEAKNRAKILEMLDDIPDAEIKPPENVLFVCKLNPITQDDDLEVIFSRFGPIKSCQIIRDWKSKESLQYAFIEYETVEACEEAYLKMDKVVIDERRIKVDFSQSVAKLWYNFKNQSDNNYDKIEDKKSKQLILPNENKKFEIKESKDFFIDKKDYSMLFHETSKQRDNNEKTERNRTLERKKKRSKSREREISRYSNGYEKNKDRKEDFAYNKDKEKKLIKKDSDKDRNRDKDRDRDREFDRERERYREFGKDKVVKDSDRYREKHKHNRSRSRSRDKKRKASKHRSRSKSNSRNKNGMSKHYDDKKYKY